MTQAIDSRRWSTVSTARSSMGMSARDLPAAVKGLANPQSMSSTAFMSSLELYNKIMGCEDQVLKGVLYEAMRVMEDALRLYGPERLIGSYNGGKDAVVIMHLQRAAMASYSVQQGTMFRPKLIYFDNPREFPEVRALVDETARVYDMEVMVYNTGFVKGLTQCIQQAGGGAFGFVLGTRKGDPNCGVQTAFCPSSDWMPPFMRVNPILEWDYGQIWRFLRLFELPYCKLYDEGYTSLGNRDDTFPNPALLKKRGDLSDDVSNASGGAQLAYYPAYMLSDWSLERAGRENRNTSTMACELRDLDFKRQRVREARSVGLIIIGDELLKGKTPDTNTAFATHRLWDKGIPVKRVAVVSDDHDDIADEVRRQVQMYDVVITSGGLGPTHDDVTIYAVASALNQRVRVNEDMLERLKDQFKVADIRELTEAQQKMAMLPELSKLRMAPADEKGWPILQCENVFILPGVPQFFEKKMDVIVNHFLDPRAMHRKKLVLSADEFSIVEQLDAAVMQHPQVTFGSYPYFDNPQFKTVITLEAPALDAVEAAIAALMQTIPTQYIIESVDDDSLRTA